MKVQKLNDIKKLYFDYRELSRVLGISLSSAKVQAARYVDAGFLVRPKRSLYDITDAWLKRNTVLVEIRGALR